MPRRPAPAALAARERALRARIDALNEEAWGLRRTDVRRALALAAEAGRLAGIAGHAKGVAWSELTRAETCFQRARYPESLAFARSALAGFARLDERRAEIEALIIVANIRLFTGAHARALESYERARRVNRAHLRDRALELRLLSNTGVARYRQGRRTEALAVYREALKLARREGDLPAEGRLLHHIGVACWTPGRERESVRWTRRSLAIAERLGDRLRQAEALCNIGEGEFLLGRLEAAREALERSRRLLLAIGERRVLACALAALGGVEAARGDFPAAERACAPARKLTRRHGDRRYEGAAELAYARLRAAQGRADEARAHLAAAQAIAEALGDDALLAELRLERRRGGAGAARRATR